VGEEPGKRRPWSVSSWARDCATWEGEFRLEVATVRAPPELVGPLPLLMSPILDIEGVGGTVSCPRLNNSFTIPKCPNCAARCREVLLNPVGEKSGFWRREGWE
jgi:hypothetical protein